MSETLNRFKTDSIYSIGTESGQSDLKSQINIANKSDCNLVQVSSRAALFHKNNLYRNLLVVIILWFVILIIALGIVLTLYFNKEKREENICKSEDCLKSAANLMTSMNLSVDPCEDFYEYVCGRWNDEHPNHGWFNHFSNFEMADERIAFKTLKFLKSNESTDDPLPVKQSRYLYNSCMNIDATKTIGYSVIFKYLNKVGLPNIPHYFKKSLNHQSLDFNWIEVEVSLRKTFAMDNFIGFEVEGSVYNRSNSVIYVGIPSYAGYLPKFFKSFKRLTKQNEENGNNITIWNGTINENDFKNKDHFLKVFQVVVKRIFENSTHFFPNQNDLKISGEIIWKIMSFIDSFNEKNITQKENLDFKIFKVEELQNITNVCIREENNVKVNKVWKKYISLLLTGIINESSADLIVDNVQVYISPFDLDYLCEVMSLIKNTQDEHLELYFWWKVVHSMIFSTASEITDEIWEIFKDEYPETYDRPKAIDCASVVVNFMGVAVSYGIADKLLLEKTVPKVNQMIDYIKKAFIESVSQINWMDEKTKQETLDKSKEMISLIGYPDWLLTKNLLEHYYENITINNYTYLENLMSIIQAYYPTMMKNYGKESERRWRTDPTTVNAYNYFADNTINVPMGILTFPFYKLGLEVLNYGAIGTILAHELTHGFDITGRKFDKFGNYKQWWTDQTVQLFDKKTECFVAQYDNFTVPGLNQKIDGRKTLAENIADNGGLHLSYYAFKYYEKDHSSRQEILPTFKYFTTDQLFFIAFGSIWCEEYNVDLIKNQLDLDEHATNYARVIVSLRNSKEFAKAFSCPLGSKMNPGENKCRIW